MSLFGDLPSARNPGQLNTQAEVPVVPQARSILKKSSMAPPPSILRSKKRKADDDSTSKSELVSSAAHGLFAAFGPIEDEYDPAVPNEYDKAKQAQQEAVLEAEREARRAAQDRSTDPQIALDNGNPSQAHDRLHHAAFDSSEAAMTLGLGSSAVSGESGGQSAGSGGMSVAVKLMKSMGWSEGEGLGKERQGISAPIILQKTDARTGVIVNAQPIAGRPALPPGNPSRVLLLRNMVGPGEVDEGLEDEVAEEVSKFGDVLRVMIFQVSGVIAKDQAVRIFVEMDGVQQAQQAIAALNGRYFDQKLISATFFDETRFQTMDLAPRSDELQ
eukprot:jgi/Ulvmu1/1842/UM119_0061.1